MRFTVTYDATVVDSYTGRVYVVMTTNTRQHPAAGPIWALKDPFFAIDVENWKPDTPLIINDDNAMAYPGPPSQTSQGEYRFTAIMRLNPDTLMLGVGHGNAFANVASGSLAGSTAGNLSIHIDHVNQWTAFPAEQDVMEYVEMRSAILSDFYGRDITMRGVIILPKGYADNPDRRYPTSYFMGGFHSTHGDAIRLQQLGSRLGFDDQLARVVLDPQCWGGHHGFADSANNGPRGRALVEEFIPELEKRYRIVAEATGRFLTGSQAGGWGALWLQLNYPETFGGVWSLAPDPVDFTSLQTADIYADGANLFVDEQDNPRPVGQRKGRPVGLVQDLVAFETVYGDGAQYGSFDWVYGPRGDDGRPRPLFDWTTGAVDPDVATYWKRFDIRLFLAEHWPELESKLAGKITIAVGEDDSAYRHLAVAKLKQAMDAHSADITIEILPSVDAIMYALLQRIDREMVERFLASEDES